MQLMHPFVQKWTMTTFPYWSASLSGFELSQVVVAVNSGARVGSFTPSTASKPGTDSRSPLCATTAQMPRLNPNRMIAPAHLEFTFLLRELRNLKAAAVLYKKAVNSPPI